MKLTDQHAGTIALIMRSPDRGEGWRTVSAYLWPMVRHWLPDDLAETVETPETGGGKIRLTEKGQALAEYMV